MKKFYLRILIIMMTISILGLIIVQMYWLRQAFESGETEFDGRVYKAMDATVNTINELELNQYYSLFENIQDTLRNAPPDTQVTTSHIENDSANTKYVYLTRYMTHKVKVPVSGVYGDSIDLVHLYASDRPIRMGKDSTINEFQPLDVDLETEFRDASYTVKQFARFDAGNKPISRRIDLNKLDSIFKKNLKVWRVSTPFELGILASDSTSITLKTKEFQLTKDNYLTPIFYAKNDVPTHYISVLLPKKDKTIFESISSLFGITLLFTLSILGVYIFSIFTMLRQRKIAEMKTDFLNNMTHEFKTPLATISVATDALKNKTVISDPNKVKHYANLIKQENKRMNNQVEMALRMSKLERNLIKLDTSKQHVNDIVNESVDSIRLLIEDRNGTITENYAAQKDELDVDSFHLGNIILNVLDNAVKYSPEKLEITVETYNKDHNYVIAVSDKGIGMNKTVQNKIFDKFYREETGNIHNVKGHGLGLAYVKHIVDLHGGTVYVESEKNNGSKFYIQLPLKK